MKMGDIKSLQKATFAFCLFGSAFLAVSFGSSYLGKYGSSLVPFSQWQANGLWWLLYTDACRVVGGAFLVAIVTFKVSQRRNGKAKDTE
jgi:SNF family Na+-dependent transporter